MRLKLKGRCALTMLLIALSAAVSSGCSSSSAAQFKAVERGVVQAVAFSPDGKIVASGASSEGIKLWNVETGELMRTLEGHTHGTESIAFSPDGRMIASGGGELKLWDVRTGQLIRTMQEEKKIVDETDIQGLAFSADGKSIASAGEQLTLWDVETGEVIREFDDGFYVLALSPDGKTIASVVRGEKVKLYEVETGKLLRELSQGNKYGRIQALAFSPDSKLLASAGGGDPPQVKVWDAGTGALKQTLSPYDIKEGFGIQAVAFSSDGRLLASGNGYKGTITIWDTKNWELKTTLDNVGLYAAVTKGGSIEAIAFSPDGKTVASGDQDGMLKLWDISGLK